MANIAKAMFFGHHLRPFFDCATFNFDGISTVLAYEVMMVGISTEAIDSLTIITSQYIDNLVVY
jgi:hypothetical protein